MIPLIIADFQLPIADCRFKNDSEYAYQTNRFRVLTANRWRRSPTPIGNRQLAIGNVVIACQTP
jgi:hypothetical protein